MKICQVVAVDFTLYHFILPLMKGLRDAGHEVVGVAAPGSLNAAVRREGFRVEEIDIERSFSLPAHMRAAGQMKSLFQREAFDLVHVHTPVASLIGRWAAWRTGVPRIVYTAHGFYFHERMAWPKRLPFIALEWLAGRVTDVLFTQAEEDAATARRYGLCGSGRIEAIGNGVDPARFGPADPAGRLAVRRELETPEGAVVIAVTGRLVAEKGYVELFDAMREVDAVLWVIGERLESDHADRIDEAIARVRADPGLANRIRFLGYRSDVPRLLAAADLFTLPSHREGMPRSVIEAMMSGLPVVATDIRGSREEVVDGATGRLVPVQNPRALADALNELVADADKRAAMGEAGRARARDLYDEAKVIARQIALLGLHRETRR